MSPFSARTGAAKLMHIPHPNRPIIPAYQVKARNLRSYFSLKLLIYIRNKSKCKKHLHFILNSGREMPISVM